MYSHVAHMALQRIFLDVAVAAVKLQRLIANFETDVGRKPLRHRAVRRRVRVPGVELPRRESDEVAGGNELRRHVRESKLQRLELGERFAELLALVEVRGGALERGLRRA